jgi:hypothetical protein
MGYWDNRVAAKENLRIFEARTVWRRYADERDESNDTVTEEGCSRALDSVLINGLNSTNLLLLTGAGASFCVKNAEASKVTSKTAPSLKDLWSAVKTKVGDTRFAAVTAIIPRGATITEIEKLLTHCKLYIELYGETDDDGRAVAEFIKDAETAILTRTDFVDDETDLTAHQSVLRKMARRGVRKPRARVFTTNYDLSIEYAARRQRFIVIDGFSHTAPQVYDRSHFGLDIVRREGAKDAPDFLDSVFQLYKLHGSIDWRRTPTEIIRSRGGEGEPVLIYPRDSKYQEAFEPPYLDMMAALQAALREPDTTIFIAGVSFNDSHIAQPIWAALESNMSFRMVVCDPAFLPEALIEDDPITIKDVDRPKNLFHQKLLDFAQFGDERLALVNGRFEDLAVALPDLVAETERERHALRMKALREATSGGEGASQP